MCQSKDSSASHGEDHGEAGRPLTAHGDPWWTSYPPAVSEGPHTSTGECLKEAVTPWEMHAGAGFTLLKGHSILP